MSDDKRVAEIRRIATPAEAKERASLDPILTVRGYLIACQHLLTALDAKDARLREAEGLLGLSRAALDPFGSKEFLARIDTFLKGANNG